MLKLVVLIRLLHIPTGAFLVDVKFCGINSTATVLTCIRPPSSVESITGLERLVSVLLDAKKVQLLSCHRHGTIR